MRFLVDAQLPPGLCIGLRQRGHDAVHVFDELPGATPDAQVAQFAIAEQRILVTKDEDFHLRHADEGLTILWLRLGNATNAALAVWLEARWTEIETALEQGERLVEVR